MNPWPNRGTRDRCPATLGIHNVATPAIRTHVSREEHGFLQNMKSSDLASQLKNCSRGRLPPSLEFSEARRLSNTWARAPCINCMPSWTPGVHTATVHMHRPAPSGTQQFFILQCEEGNGQYDSKLEGRWGEGFFHTRPWHSRQEQPDCNARHRKFD